MFRRLIYAALLIAALAALQAPAASALGGQCSGANVSGKGSFLQNRAQAIWSGKESGFNVSKTPTACSGGQGSGGIPKVAYTPIGSGAALHAWGADDGVFHDESTHFLTTDTAPSGPAGEEGTQIAEMSKALGSGLVVVPVANTSIAIVAEPPQLPAHPACELTQIIQADLEGIFSGQLTNWRQVGTVSDTEAGGDCDQAITRVVREEASGTTYQFKHFLGELQPEDLECTGETSQTWAQLQPGTQASTPNTSWPRKADCQEGEGPVTTVAVVGEGAAAPVEYVLSNPGTITFAPLPVAGPLASGKMLQVWNGIGFANPNNEQQANCNEAAYELPAGVESGVNVDWSGVYGSNPVIGSGSYPLCTLSWIVVPELAANVFSNKIATTLRDYLSFVNAEAGGREEVLGQWYAHLPGPVVSAAEVAIEKIGGEGEEEEGGPKTGTVLCKASPEVKAGVFTCPAGQGFAGKVTGTVVPSTVATFTSTAGLEGTISCAKGNWTGEFKEDGTSAGAGVTLFTLGTTEGCSTTFPEEPEAVVEMINLPYEESRFVYLNWLSPQGAFVWAKTEGEQIQLRVKGTAPEGCNYSPAFLSGQVINGTPSKMLITGTWEFFEGSEEQCAAVLQQSAQMTVTRTGEGLPLYLTGQ